MKKTEQLLKEFEQFRILIIGDVMLDAYMWGQVTRISPEAPVPVLTYSNSENRLGGAANVALNIDSLGAVPVICSVIGRDENGNIVRELMKQRKWALEGLVETELRTTTVKTRIIAGRQQLIRIDREDDHLLEPDLQQLLWNRVEHVISTTQINAIIFQDYDKGVITSNLIGNVIRLAREQRIPTLVDPKKRNFSAYRNATLFKPNLKELLDGLNAEIRKDDIPALTAAVKKLHLDWGYEYVLLTLSEEGMIISEADRYHHVPTHTIDIADVSGAGDTVIAVASLCLAAGVDPLGLAKLANFAAGMVCEKVGVVPVKKEWLLNAKISFIK